MNKSAINYQPIRTSADLSGDAVVTHKASPPSDLSDIVMDFWQYDVSSGFDYIPVQVFPSGCVVLRFNIRPDHVESVIYGPSLNNNMKGFFYHDWVIFGVALRPQRAYQLLGLSLHELRDLRVRLEMFWPVLVPLIEEQLWHSKTFNERLKILITFLRSILRTDISPDAGFLNAFIDIVRYAPHAEDIGLIAKKIGTPGRTLRRYFSKYLGLGPKQFHRLVRVQNSMRGICALPESRLADLAVVNGFNDQAHLTREFRSVTGYSPSRFSSLIGKIHDESLNSWADLNPKWRNLRSPDVIRFE